ncbi:MAG: HupE/UreJ family protein [Pseudomonadota bacterium]
MKISPLQLLFGHIARPLRVVLGAIVVVVAILAAPCLTPTAWAHPEDEFCTADSGLDPALCRQLAQMDSAAAPTTAITALTDADGNPRSWFDTGLLYIKIGIQHILPGGADHILFVLALFLAATGVRSLVLQISTFTLAHTITLGIAASGLINPPAAIVEPLIALSIAFVAIETIIFREVPRWRLLVVFGFGLFHGLGFAGFIREFGLPPAQFWSSLMGFNVGVELGQLTIVILAFLIRIPIIKVLGMRSEIPASLYRQVVVIPASVIIALTGLSWSFTRVFGV